MSYREGAVFVIGLLSVISSGNVREEKVLFKWREHEGWI